MKSLLLLSILGGAAALAGTAMSSPAEARGTCTRVATPNDPAFLAITHCQGVTLPPFFEAIGWQRLENRTWPGSTNTESSSPASTPTPPKEHHCEPRGS